jgi:hypothetical protein
LSVAGRTPAGAARHYRPTSRVRKLGTLTGGRIGLWTGNGSDGDFKDFRILNAR